MTLSDITWQGWYTVVVVLAMFLSLLFTKIRAEVAFLATISALFLGGVLDVKGAFGGFSSESVIVVAILYVVIAGLTYTGVLNWIVKNVMGMPKTLSGAMVRLMVPVAVLSSFLTNTTVVALFINVVKIWANKLGVSPSKLLIPLSYASGMGGVCTLIGTAPNLIISGFYTEATGITLSLLTPTLCGLFCLFVGVLSMVAMQKMLPERKSPVDNGHANDFTAEVTVQSVFPYIGNTVGELKSENMSSLKDVEFVAIRRFDNEIVAPVSDDEFIMGGDRLILNGKTKSIHSAVKTLGLSCPALAGVLDSEVDPDSINPRKTLLSALILIAMVALSATKVLPLLSSCLLAAIAMIVFRCCTSSQAMKAIDWNIIIIFAGSVAIGKAIDQTGLATLVANSLLSVCGTNPYVVLFVVCLVATFVTEFISNTAAAAMFYPIAMSSALAIGVNPLTFCVALMISISSSFATPIGSPTHMLVYIPGGYRFSDYAKVGIPMNFIILFANMIITPILFPMH